MKIKKIESRAAGRPKTTQKNHQILNAAGKLFCQHGLQNVSMDWISHEAGVSKQTIYSHFQNKETLFAAVITSKVHSYQIENVDEIPLHSLQDCLLELGNRVTDLIMDPQAMQIARVVIAESVHYPAISQLFFENGPQRAQNFVTSNIKRLVHQHRIAEPDPETLAQTFVAMLKGEWYTRLLMNVGKPPSTRQRRQHVKHCVSLVLKLIQTKNS